MTFSIGFHGGPGGNHNGLGNYYHQLDGAGIPFFIKSSDHFGHCFEAANIARASGVPHSIVFRLTTYGQNDGYQYDVPPYEFPPVEAAAIHWTRTRAKLPPEFDKGLVWVEPINEIDKNRSDWLGHFAAEIGTLAMNDGYKVTLFAWSSGEPEPAHWQTPGMRRYLTMCAQHPDRLAVSLHEYSYTLDNIKDQYPNKVGRFQQFFAVCDAMGIARPTVHITEWGWTHEEVPEPTQALLDIDWAYRLYAPHPQIKGVAIWYLGQGFGGIANLAQRLIAPVTDYMLNAPAVPPAPQPNPDPIPPPGGTLEDHLWSLSGMMPSINFDPALGLWQRIIADGYHPVHTEVATSFSGVSYAIQQAFKPEQPRRLYVWTPNKPLYFLIEGQTTPPTPQFRATAWPKTNLRTTQWFAANPENYAQFGLPGHDGWDGRAALGEAIKAVASGTVSQVHNPPGNHNYGIHVRIDHGDGNETVYAHLSQPSVTVGQQVTAGQTIGLAGATGNSSGVHLHMTYKRHGQTYTDPAGQVWPNNLHDPWTMLEPLYQDYLNQSGIIGYLWGASTVKHPHFNWGFGSTNLNLRQSPETNAPILGLVQAGVPFRITGPRTASGYYPAVALLGDLPPGTVPPSPNLIDLRRFKIADPDAWRVVRNQRGEQEDIQDLELSGGIYVRRKNQLAEWHGRDGSFFYLIHDTSPAPGSEGVDRVYTLYKNGQAGAPKSKIQQVLGELWVEAGVHLVQFRAKSDCRNLAENSGNAQNSSVIYRHETNFTFNGYGQNLTFDEVIWERTGSETQIYGIKNGRSCGWIGWQETPTSPVTEPVEVHFDRGRMTQEPYRYCNW